MSFIGKSTKNISANDLIWEFFREAPDEVRSVLYLRWTLMLGSHST